MEHERIALEHVHRAPNPALGSIGNREAGELSRDGGQLDANERHEFSLPPVDGGKDAWLFLAACFMVEALVWGFAFAFGIFQDFYSTHEPFAGSRNIAVIGTCAMGIMYLDAPLIFAALHSWPQIRRISTVVGLVTMCLAIGLSSLSRSVTHLIVTQGILYALGGSIVYCPCILFLNEWFVQKKGMAFGVMWAGTGLAGVVLPMVMEWLLHSYGFRATLRIWSLTLFVLTAPLVYFIKPRLPLSQTSRPRPYDYKFLLLPAFGIFQLGNVLEALGYFLPSIYLPAYARSLGAGGGLSALTVILFNVASVFGCVMMGIIIDRLHVTTCIMVSTIGATMGVFLIWGLSTTLPPLYVFSIVYGLFAGSYTSAWPGIMRDVQKKRDSADLSMIFAYLAAGRGVGNVASGPLSEALLRRKPWLGQGRFGYGNEYGSIIVFTGITTVLGGLSFGARRAGWL